MPLGRSDFGNSFFAYQPTQDFHTPERAVKDYNAILVFDKNKKQVRVLDQATTPDAQFSTYLPRIIAFIKKKLPTDRKMQEWFREPDLYANTNRRVEQINALIGKHNKHVDQSFWIELVHIILLVLTLGCFHYKPSLYLSEIPLLDVANTIPDLNEDAHKEQFLKVITLLDLLRSKKPDQVLEKLGKKDALDEISATKDPSVFVQLQKAKDKYPELISVFRKPLAELFEEKNLTALVVLLSSDEEIRTFKFFSEKRKTLGTICHQALAVRCAQQPRSNTVFNQNTFNSIPAAHIQYLNDEKVSDCFKMTTAKNLPPLYFFSKEQIGKIDLSALSDEKIRALLLPTEWNREKFAHLTPAQLNILKDHDLIGEISPFLSDAQLQKWPEKLPEPLNGLLTALLNHANLSETEKQKRVSLFRERLLAVSNKALGIRGDNSSILPVPEYVISHWDFSINPLDDIQSLNLLKRIATGPYFQHVNPEQLQAILRWINENPSSAPIHLGACFSEEHWKSLTEELITETTLPFIFSKPVQETSGQLPARRPNIRLSASEMEGIEQLSPKLLLHIRKLKGSEHLHKSIEDRLTPQK